MSDKSKEDVFTRAGWLIGHSYVKPGDGADVLKCLSQTHGESVVYDVTYDTCTCYIGEFRKSKICKHRLACFAAPVVLMVLEIRDIVTEEYLETIGKEYAEAIKGCDDLFIAIARTEYMKKLEEIRSKETAAA